MTITYLAPDEEPQRNLQGSGSLPYADYPDVSDYPDFLLDRGDSSGELLFSRPLPPLLIPGEYHDGVQQLAFPSSDSEQMFSPYLQYMLQDEPSENDDEDEEKDEQEEGEETKEMAAPLTIITAPTLGMDVESKHQRTHELQVEWIERCVLRHRDRIGLDSAWKIQAQVLCRHEMSESEAALWYDASLKYALLRMRCDIPSELLTWLVVHELHELLLWEMDQVFTALLYQHPQDTLSHYIERQMHMAKNRVVELLTYRHLGYQRPTHLLLLPPSDFESRQQPRVGDVYGVGRQLI